MKKNIILCSTLLFILLSILAVSAQEPVTVARIKYGGGGDWYGNRTTFPNIFKYMREHLGIETAQREVTVEVMKKDLFRYPIIYLAGHGNVKFSEDEIARLRLYLTNGGFLWADDDYGMDKFFRREMKRVFPELEWVELPFSHPIFHSAYDFPNGLPKVHKHAGGPPKALALFYEGRMVVFYSFNTDISDGCEDPDIHGDPPPVRESALKMGTNILLWALTH
ncbi:MAG TPA: DUF4159 domain-containing protein [Caldithrix sp.]|nr:DUF4159 domain-containing protein [Caldithrix sp.]